MTFSIPQAKRPLDIQPLTMNPLDLIGWALAIGIAWTILTSCIPLESWISSLIDSVKKRRGQSSANNDDDTE